jgi:beta-lactamase regulating signal transducer with metallopeptidase domain
VDAVLNWLWQGSVVVLALALMLQLLERSRAHVRYVVCWMALVSVFTLPLVPFLGAAVTPLDIVPIAVAGPIIPVPHAWWTSSAVLIALWALWAGIHVVRLARAMLSLRGIKRRSRVCPTTVERSLCHWVGIRDRGRQAVLVVSDGVTAAAVLGCRSPVIAVAPALVDHLDADELDRVIIHEWAHVQRRDDLANVLQLIARAIAGWHPAVWWIDRRLRIEREVACDEMAVSITGSPKSYAACLIKLANLPLVRPAALPAPGMLTPLGLRGRIVRIVSRREFATPSWSRSVATIVVALLGALSVAVGGLQLVESAVVSPNADIPPTTVPVDGVPPNAFEEPRALDAAQQMRVRTAEFAAGPPAGSPRRFSLRVKPAPAEPLATAASATPLRGPHVVNTEGQESTDSAGDVSGNTLVPVPSASAPIATAVAIGHIPDTQPPVVEAPTRSPWNAAADAGVAIGRSSKTAGVATAGFFNRVGRRIAGSF